MFTKLFSKKRFLAALSAAALGLVFIAPGNASTFGEVMMTPTTKTTYICANAFFTPPASATDIWQIYGSSSKTVKILEVRLTLKSSASATYNDFYLLKRSTANTSGTAVTATPVALDSSNAAATAVVKHYTANPTTGTLVGTVATFTTNGTSNSAVTAQLPQGLVLFDHKITGQPVVLRGTGEGLVLNCNGVTVANSGSPCVTVVFTEE